MSIMTPEQIIREIIKKEGGWADHKNDKGGATNFGISLRYAKSKGLMFDLDGDGDVDADDIRLVTRETAFDAFLEDFYRAPGFNRLPESLRAQMTDYGVNSGPGQAVKSLQRAVNRITGSTLAADGDLGPRTMSAVRLCCDIHKPKTLNNALVEERLKFLAGVVAANPTQRDFIAGWNTRARSFLI